jgi:hypothetical protein
VLVKGNSRFIYCVVVSVTLLYIIVCLLLVVVVVHGLRLIGLILFAFVVYFLGTRLFIVLLLFSFIDGVSNS